MSIIRNKIVFSWSTFSLFYLFLSSLFFSNIHATNNLDDGSYLLLPSDEDNNNKNNIEMCKEVYGFVPCSNSVAGNLLLITIYGYFMFKATRYLSDGSEVLAELIGDKFVMGNFISGCFLRLLGSLPDALIVLGVYGSTTTAEEKVSIGMGLMAGSTVMRLTLIWATYVLVGKCNLKASQSLDLKDTKGFHHLLGSGISYDIWTKYAAWMMCVSMIPLFVVQIPQAFDSTTSRRHLAVLIALIISALLLISYCLYEVSHPWMRQRWLEYVKHKKVMSGFVKHLYKHCDGSLWNDDGTPKKEHIIKLFKLIDTNDDKELSREELKAFVVGIKFQEISLCEEDVADKIMAEFDTERRDGKVDVDEFIHGVSKLRHLFSQQSSETIHHSDSFDEEAKLESSLSDNNTKEKDSKEDKKPMNIGTRAILFVIYGIFLTGLFAEPLIDSFHNLSNATGFPMFFLSFVALPLVTNSGEAFCAMKIIRKKKKESTEVAFSELYGLVTIDNLLCLIAFLAVVYVRALPWDFSAEMLIIFLVFVIMGPFASFRTVFPLWIAYLAILVYPFLLVVVYLLKYVLGWS